MCIRDSPWDVLKAPGFYSEQSYDHDPWRPYRQGIHRLLPAEAETFIVENYGFADPIRLAGAGQRPELLNSLKPESLKPRCGCGMHFREVESGRYLGEVEPGKNCMVPRDGRLTYLVSEVDVNDESLTFSRDQSMNALAIGPPGIMVITLLRIKSRCFQNIPGKRAKKDIDVSEILGILMRLLEIAVVPCKCLGEQEQSLVVV